MLNIKLLNQFRSFYFNNYPEDMETQISYFTVFGGLNCTIDTSRPITHLIRRHILDNFETLERLITQLTGDNAHNKRLLRALATGDRRIFTAFNKAGLNNGNGGAALNYLQEQGIIQLEYSRERHPRELYPKMKLKREEARHRISHKVLFTHPFVRFWFYFVAPNIQEIKEGNYDKFFHDFETKRNSYTSLVYEELSEVLLNYNLRDTHILSSGSYWDAKTEIDLLTVTQNGKIYVGECKWTNHKINKKELHKLKDKCKRLGFEPDQFVFFSKRGFSKELQQLQSADLALYSSEDFQDLLKNSSKNTYTEDFIN